MRGRGLPSRTGLRTAVAFNGRHNLSNYFKITPNRVLFLSSAFPRMRFPRTTLLNTMKLRRYIVVTAIYRRATCVRRYRRRYVSYDAAAPRK